MEQTLKLENEVVSEDISKTIANESISEVNNQYHEELLKNQEAENIVENTLEDDEKSFSQEAIDPSETDQGITSDLKEFGVDTDEPDLFNSDIQNSNSEDLLGLSDKDNEEDDLEIPAFQKKTKKLMVFEKINGSHHGIDTPKHYPVLLNEIISIITPHHGGTFIDCTFGQGGYTEKILSYKNTKVIAIDRDNESKKLADKFSENFKKDFILKIKSLVN